MQQATPRGRPKNYDPEKALDQAMQQFWQEGYERTSMDQLCRAMNMPRASIYADYHSKEDLFLASLSHYEQSRLMPVFALLGPTSTLQNDLQAFFAAMLQLATEGPVQRGCLISSALSEASLASPRFQAELEQRYSVLEETIARRIIAEHPEKLSWADGLSEAMILASLLRGLVMRARTGTGFAQLKQAAFAGIDRIVPSLRHNAGPL